MILFNGKARDMTRKEIVLAWNFGRIMETPHMVHCSNQEFSFQSSRELETLEAVDFGRN